MFKVTPLAAQPQEYMNRFAATKTRCFVPLPFISRMCGRPHSGEVDDLDCHVPVSRQRVLRVVAGFWYCAIWNVAISSRGPLVLSRRHILSECEAILMVSKKYIRPKMHVCLSTRTINYITIQNFFFFRYLYHRLSLAGAWVWLTGFFPFFLVSFVYKG